MRTLAMALCLTLTPSPLQTQSIARVPDFAEARRLIREGMAKDSVTAVAIAVVRDGAIVWEEGFGWADRERQLAATPNTPFLLASLTKTLEATLAAAMREQRRLDLDKPVNDYLRTSSVWSPAWDAHSVTIRQLLMHTSGLSTFDIVCDADLPASSCHFPSSDATIQQYAVVVHRPGQQFDYSNLGYFVAGEAIARAVQRPLRDLLRAEVFRPLGMTHASLGLDSAEARIIAVPFSWTKGLVREQPSATAAVTYASGRGYASAHDLALFAAFHLKAHRGDQRAILSDAAIDSMQQSTISAGGVGSRYGLGWWIEENRFGYRSVLAQGGNDRTSTWLRLIPTEHVAVVLLANKGVAFPEAAADAALAAMLPRYGEGVAAREHERAANQTATTSTTRTIGMDSMAVGVWSGRIRTPNGDVPLKLTIAESGDVQAGIGSRAEMGHAGIEDGTLLLRIPGDLELPNPPGKNRQLRFYLDRYGAGFGGVVTTRPPNASGLDGAVSYWAEITRDR